MNDHINSLSSMDSCDLPRPSAKVSFALIGDVQYADREPAGRNYRQAHTLLNDTISILNSKDLAFIVNPGDLGDGVAKSEIPDNLEIFA